MEDLLLEEQRQRQAAMRAAKKAEKDAAKGGLHSISIYDYMAYSGFFLALSINNINDFHRRSTATFRSKSDIKAPYDSIKKGDGTVGGLPIGTPRGTPLRPGGDPMDIDGGNGVGGGLGGGLGGNGMGGGLGDGIGGGIGDGDGIPEGDGGEGFGGADTVGMIFHSSKNG